MTILQQPHQTTCRTVYAGSALCALLLAGCTTLEPDPKIGALEERYNQVSTLPSVDRESANELAAAELALGHARKAHIARKPDLVSHELIVAGKSLDIAETRVELRKIKGELNNASTRRQRLLLSARERDLDSAESELARNKAELAARERERNAAQEQALALAAELEDLKVKNNERGMILTLSDIVFGFDSSQLKPGADRTIEKIHEFLQNHPERKIVVEGFTDADGSEEYNMALSRRRADAVRNGLLALGMGRGRITTQGFGEAHPVASNSTAAGKQQNRRVEIVIGDAAGADVKPRTAMR